MREKRASDRRQEKEEEMTRKTGERNEMRGIKLVRLYTKGEINEKWRNRRGNEKVMVGLAERNHSQTQPVGLVGLPFCYNSSYNYHHVDIFYYGILAYIGGIKFKSALNIAEQNIHLTNGPSPTAGCSVALAKILVHQGEMFLLLLSHISRFSFFFPFFF